MNNSLPNDEKEKSPFSESASSDSTGNCPTGSDESSARRLQTIEALTSLFGFNRAVAFRAVDAIDDESDVTEAYNWILDHGGGEDRGGPVTPKLNCPHLSNHVKVTVDCIRIGSTCEYYKHAQAAGNITQEKTGKTEAGEDEDLECSSGENWLCLECNAIRCSRYVKGHCLAHWNETMGSKGSSVDEAGKDGAGHCVAISLSDLSVWCYACRAYVHHSSTVSLVERLQELKFGGEA